MANTKFESTAQYVASEQLLASVNVAIALQKPLLIKGEPAKRPDSSGPLPILTDFAASAKSCAGLNCHIHNSPVVLRISVIAHIIDLCYDISDAKARNCFFNKCTKIR